PFSSPSARYSSRACIPFYQCSKSRATDTFPTRRSSDLQNRQIPGRRAGGRPQGAGAEVRRGRGALLPAAGGALRRRRHLLGGGADRKSTRLNSSHVKTSYAVFCLKNETDHVPHIGGEKL